MYAFAQFLELDGVRKDKQNTSNSVKTKQNT